MNQYLLVGLFYLIAVVIFAGFAAVLFYHVGRYSLIGDASKRMLVIFISFSLILIILTPIIIIVNNLLS